MSLSGLADAPPLTAGKQPRGSDPLGSSSATQRAKFDFGLDDEDLEDLTALDRTDQDEDDEDEYAPSAYGFSGTAQKRAGRATSPEDDEGAGGDSFDEAFGSLLEATPSNSDKQSKRNIKGRKQKRSSDKLKRKDSSNGGDKPLRSALKSDKQSHKGKSVSFTGEQKNKAASHAVPQPSSSGKAASSGHKKSKDPAASAADALSALEPSFPTKGKKHKSSNKAEDEEFEQLFSAVGVTYDDDQPLNSDKKSSLESSNKVTSEATVRSKPAGESKSPEKPHSGSAARSSYAHAQKEQQSSEGVKYHTTSNEDTRKYTSRSKDDDESSLGDSWGDADLPLFDDGSPGKAASPKRSQTHARTGSHRETSDHSRTGSIDERVHARHSEMESRPAESIETEIPDSETKRHASPRHGDGDFGFASSHSSVVGRYDDGANRGDSSSPSRTSGHTVSSLPEFSSAQESDLTEQHRGQTSRTKQQQQQQGSSFEAEAMKQYYESYLRDVREKAEATSYEASTGYAWEDASKRLAESRIAAAEAEVEKLRTTMDARIHEAVAKVRKEERETAEAIRQQTISNIRQEYRDEIRRIQQQCDEQIASLKRRHQEEIAEVRRRNDESSVLGELASKLQNATSGLVDIESRLDNASISVTSTANRHLQAREDSATRSERNAREQVQQVSEQVSRLRSLLSAFEEGNSSVRDGLENDRSRLRYETESLKSLQETLSDGIKSIRFTVSEERQSLQDQRREIERERQQILKEAEEEREEANAAKRDADRIRSEAYEFKENKLAEIKREYEQLRPMTNEYIKQVQEAAKERASLSQTKEVMQTEKDELERRRKALDEAEKEYERRLQRLERMSSDIQEEARQVGETKTHAETLEREASEKEQWVQSTKQQLEQKWKQLEQAAKSINEEKNNIANARVSLAEEQQKFHRERANATKSSLRVKQLEFEWQNKLLPDQKPGDVQTMGNNYGSSPEQKHPSSPGKSFVHSSQKKQFTSGGSKSTVPMNYAWNQSEIQKEVQSWQERAQHNRSYLQDSMISNLTRRMPLQETKATSGIDSEGMQSSLNHSNSASAQVYGASIASRNLTNASGLNSSSNFQDTTFKTLSTLSTDY